MFLCKNRECREQSSPTLPAKANNNSKICYWSILKSLLKSELKSPDLQADSLVLTGLSVVFMTTTGLA